MKKQFFFGLALIALLSEGCPIGMDYSLGDPGKEKLDDQLIGTWESSDSESEVLKVKIQRADANSYSVQVMEKGAMYALETDQFTGWVTDIKDAHFVYFKPDNEEKYYHYQYKITGDELVTNDVSTLDKGMDAITSTQSFREEIERSMKMSTWGEGKIAWYKE